MLLQLALVYSLIHLENVRVEVHMRKNLKRPLVFLLVVVLFAGISVYAVHNFGSQEDPLITRSYLEKVLQPKLEQEYADKTQATVDELEERIDTELNGSFRPATLEKGGTIVCQSGCEFLLRDGQLRATGDFMDVTAGKMITEYDALEQNHLYMALGEITLEVALKEEPTPEDTQTVTLMLRGEYAETKPLAEETTQPAADTPEEKPVENSAAEPTQAPVETAE